MFNYIFWKTHGNTCGLNFEVGKLSSSYEPQPKHGSHFSNMIKLSPYNLYMGLVLIKFYSLIVHQNILGIFTFVNNFKGLKTFIFL
jgi:hypothetical protein